VAGPDEITQQPELVVLGKARLLGKGGITDNFVLPVDKVLYGAWAPRRLKFTGSYHESGGFDGQRRIFALAPHIYRLDTWFQLRYSLEPTEEKAARALGAARLDFNVLAAQCIFVGREVAFTDNYHRTVKVVCPVAGAAPARGRIVTVATRATPTMRIASRLFVRDDRSTSSGPFTRTGSRRSPSGRSPRASSTTPAAGNPPRGRPTSVRRSSGGRSTRSASPWRKGNPSATARSCSVAQWPRPSTCWGPRASRP
jgi:hypothetical protein